MQRNLKTISYRFQSTDSAIFMASSSWYNDNLNNNLLIILLKKFVKLNVNTGMIIENVKHVEVNTKIASVFLNTEALKLI